MVIRTTNTKPPTMQHGSHDHSSKDVLFHMLPATSMLHSEQIRAQSP
jgi:hypothetical protein